MWGTGLVTLWHVGSSQSRVQTCVPCIGRHILYQGSPGVGFFLFYIFTSSVLGFQMLENNTRMIFRASKQGLGREVRRELQCLE